MSITTKNCLVCKREFSFRTSQKRPGIFCSHSCQLKYYTKRVPAKFIELTCKTCGKIFKKSLAVHKRDSKKCNAGKFCGRECFYKSPERSPNRGKKGANSAGWKGGRIYERGYRLVLAQNHPNSILKGGGLKYIREHRLIMEKHLGRYLNKEEVVHHINGDVSDNRIENLVLYVNDAEHIRFHKNNSWRTKCDSPLKKLKEKK